jgi:hypothetical protein
MSEMAMFRPRGAMNLKMHRGKLVKVTIGLAEPKRGVTQSGVL